MILITDLKQKMTMVFSKNYLRPFFLNCHFLRVKFFIDRIFFVEITKEIKGFGCIPHDLSADKADMGGALQTPSGLTGNNLDAVDTVFAALKGFSPRGPFNNYVVIILAFLCPPTYCYVNSFTLHVDKNGHFWTTYPPHFVHVVNERPLGRRREREEAMKTVGH